MKEIQQQYWRIDYKLFIDAVKLRIHKMQHSLHKAKAERVTLYVCESCVDAEGRNPSYATLIPLPRRTPGVCFSCWHPRYLLVVCKAQPGACSTCGRVRMHSAC